MIFRTLCISVLLISASIAPENDAIAMNDGPDTLRLSQDRWPEGNLVRLWEMPWRFHPGDDPVWANPESDDGSWSTVSTALRQDEFPVNEWPGVGWFRLHIVVDSTFPRSSLGLAGSHSGTIRLYWDGHLLLDRLRYRLPGELHVTPGHHVLAVRYELKDLQAIHDAGQLGGFFVELGEFEYAIDNMLRQKAEQMFFGGLLLAFGILHFVLFLFSPSSRGNLPYALFLFFFVVSLYADIQHSFLSSDSGDTYRYLIAHRAVVPIVSILFLWFIYSIFYTRIPRQFWFLMALMAVVGVIIHLNPVADYQFYVIGSTILTLEMVRVLVVAVRKRKPGARIMAAGFILLGIFSSYDTLLDLDLLAPINHITNAYYFGLLGLVGATSIYLARDFSQTSRRLVEQVKRTQEEEIARRLVETDNVRKTRELEEARQLQLSMLPVCRNDLPGFDLCFHMETATEVGGDYYDYHTSADGSLTIAVGDATGHGMKAGTMVSIIKGLFITNAPIDDGQAFLRKCSEAIRGMKLGNLFMGLTLARFRDGHLTVASAGMPPVLVYRSASRSVEELVIKSMPLGGPGPLEYEIREAKLEPGDVVLLLSDGLPELFNPQGEILDYPRVKELFAEAADGSATEIVRSLAERGHQWAAGRAQSDDVTLVLVKKT